MEILILEGMEVMPYRNLKEGYSAMVTYHGQTVTVDLDGKPLETLLTDEFVLFVQKADDKTKIRVMDLDKNKLVYDLVGFPLKRILNAKAAMVNCHGLDRWWNGYVVNGIKRLTPELVDYCKSYMPKKRSSINKSIRMQVYDKCDGHCAYCGKPIKFEEMQVDHVESHYRHQGRDELGNYLPACRDCNGLKSDYLLEEFRNVLIPSCARKGMNNLSESRRARIAKAYRLNGANPKKKIVFYFEKDKKDED